MALVNHAKREINAKIVYYGPEMAGKATSLRYVYDRIKPALRGELKVIPASGSSLLFFDFSPFEQPVFGGYRLRLHIYTLQGAVANPAAWKMTLKGADGLVVVADASLPDMTNAVESVLQLRNFMESYGVGLRDIPYILQLNKKDSAMGLSAEEALALLGIPDCMTYETSALRGEGVLETLSSLSKLVMERLSKRDDLLQHARTEFVKDIDSVPGSAETLRHHTVVAQTDVSIENAVGTIMAGDAPVQDGTTKSVVEIKLSGDGPKVDGSTVVIPLEITKSGSLQRFVLTVSLDAK